MGLREDMETLQRHIENGTGRAYLEGTAPRLKPEPMPKDPTATMSMNAKGWEAARGD